jgi:hypothetical protein
LGERPAEAGKVGGSIPPIHIPIFSSQKIYKSQRIRIDMKKGWCDLSVLDMQLTKLAVFFFAFWIVSFIATDFIIKYRWIWFLVFLVFAIKPFGSFWFGRKR